MNDKLTTLIALLKIYTETGVEGVKTTIRPAMASLFEDITNPFNQLTKEEIQLGVSDGKIACLKAYKERTQRGLKESKDAIEKYFTDNNLMFRHW